MNDRRRKWNEPNLAPTDVKRQHYVPRMYLKAFAGADGNIRVVDLDGGKEFRTSVENAAVGNYFNDVGSGDERLSTEGWLSELEGNASPVLTKLIHDPNAMCSLEIVEEIHLARFIAALRFRTPAFREWDAEITSQMASQAKEIIKGGLYNKLEEEEADAYWDLWKDKPDHWWFTQSDEYQPSATAASMLSEVQGYANLFLAAPWRIGQAAPSLQLYTSDNPVASYWRPVRTWWETAAFSSLDYYLPLSPSVLLYIRHRPHNEEDESEDWRGERRCKDFSEGEISIARHVVTLEATRFLYGDGRIVPRECAKSCLSRIDKAKRQFARYYLGGAHDLRPSPGLNPFPTDKWLTLGRPGSGFRNYLALRAGVGAAVPGRSERRAVCLCIVRSKLRVTIQPSGCGAAAAHMLFELCRDNFVTYSVHRYLRAISEGIHRIWMFIPR